jgi:hypothetical protein
VTPRVLVLSRGTQAHQQKPLDWIEGQLAKESQPEARDSGAVSRSRSPGVYALVTDPTHPHPLPLPLPPGRSPTPLLAFSWPCRHPAEGRSARIWHTVEPQGLLFCHSACRALKHPGTAVDGGPGLVAGAGSAEASRDEGDRVRWEGGITGDRGFSVAADVLCIPCFRWADECAVSRQNTCLFVCSASRHACSRRNAHSGDAARP